MDVDERLLDARDFFSRVLDVDGKLEGYGTVRTSGNKINLQHPGFLLLHALNQVHLSKRQASLWVDDFFNLTLDLVFQLSQIRSTLEINVMKSRL
jgi:hypothetical protein